MSVESAHTRGDREEVTGHVHDVSDLTVAGLQSFARSAVDGDDVHVERQDGRTLLVVD